MNSNNSKSDQLSDRSSQSSNGGSDVENTITDNREQMSEEDIEVDEDFVVDEDRYVDDCYECYDSDDYESDDDLTNAYLLSDNHTFGDTNLFKAEFELKYGSRHPVFYSGTYNQALDVAKRDLKFLVVYLHSESHEDTDEYCRSVITSQQFIDFLTQNNLLFWSSSVTYSEGYRVSQQLRETTYPYLALIGLKVNRMVVLRKVEGKATIESIVAELKRSIEENESSLLAARLEREERSMNQLLRKEQDEAFAESLKADQEKERKKMEEKNKRDAEEKAKKAQESEENHRIQQLLQLREQLVNEIPPEPERSDKNATQLVIKLPNGTRLERRFLKTESIRFLYIFVFCHKDSPLNFIIRTNFPTRDLPGKSPQLDDYVFNVDNTVRAVGTGSEESPTFVECGLGVKEMLFVHDLEA